MKEDRGVVGVSKGYLSHTEISLIVDSKEVYFLPVEVKKKITKKTNRLLATSLP